MPAVEGYLCPSDTHARDGRSVYFTASTFRNGLSTGNLGKSNYVMNESVGADTNAPNGPHRIAEIRDGTSNVMHVAEKDEIHRVAASAFVFTRSTASVGFRVMSPLNSLNQGTDGAVTYDDTQQPCARYRVGSLHPGGANILFCDGSVHFISETIPAAQGNDCGNSYATSVVHKYDPINRSGTNISAQIKSGKLPDSGTVLPQLLGKTRVYGKRLAKAGAGTRIIEILEKERVLWRAFEIALGAGSRQFESGRPDLREPFSAPDHGSLPISGQAVGPGGPAEAEA